MPNPTKVPKKQVFIRAYRESNALTRALAILKDHPQLEVKPTLIVKVGQKELTQESLLGSHEKLKDSCHHLWHNTPDQLIFFQNTIGTFSVIGALARIFHNKIGGSHLAEMTNGPANILRGMGLSEADTSSHLQSLFDGEHLLIVRLFPHEWELLETALNGLDDQSLSIS